MKEETFRAVAEMKYLFDCGADIDFLASIYPMSKEKIKEFCEELDKSPNAKKELLNKYIDECLYPIDGVFRE